MNQSKRENFHTKLADTPPAVRVFFLSILLHFEQDPATIVHYTLTNGGDLRLAVSPPTKSSKTRMRNFATLYWQSRNRVVFTRLYLTPSELAQLDFHSASVPKRAAEPLLSEIRLSEIDLRDDSHKFVTVLEQSKRKMLAIF